MAKQRTPVLKVSKLSTSYGPVAIITDFSLEVWPGASVALTGLNGAGKSTILRCLVGPDTLALETILICCPRIRALPPPFAPDP